ncbi:histone-fold-containing protein [Lipomyces orientalis]|uniref:Histone-fold-containing protein n=1 Tax=Lipomyces orientalis TaxID=1233043 RepID=A0ACC3TJ44_9ASCO
MPRGVKKSASTASAEGTPALDDATGIPTATTTSHSHAHGIDDYMLPKATVTRLAKHVLPANTQIQKDAMTALSKSATVFINYLTSTANDLTIGSGRRTVNPSDVYKAIELLELDFFLPRLKAEVDKFVEVASTKHKKPTKGVDESQIAVAGADEETGDGPPTAADDEGGERTVKKAKIGNGKVVSRQPSVRDEDETEVEDTEEEVDEEDDDDDDPEDDPEQPEDGSSAEDAFEDAKNDLDDDSGTVDITVNVRSPRASSRDRVLAKDPDALSGSEDDDSD